MTLVASSPGSPIFSMYTRKEGDLIPNLTWQTLARCHEREADNNCWFRMSLPDSVYQMQLFEAFNDRTTLAWRLWHHIFQLHVCWTGTLENLAHPRSIITTCHPLYLCIWACHVRLDPRLPLILVYVVVRSKIGEPGDEAITLVYKESLDELNNYYYCLSMIIAYSVL